MSRGPIPRLALILAALSLMLCGAARPSWARGLPLMVTVVEPNTAQTPGAAGVKPAEGVTVMIKDTDQHETTDAMGGARFPSVKEGELTLVATKPGYGQTVKDYTLKGPLPGQVLLYIMPGGALTMQQAPIQPDTVYVAFAGLDSGMDYAANRNMPGRYSVNPMNPLGGIPQVNMSVLGAINMGQDPFTMGGNTPPPGTPPGMIPSPGGSYTTNLNTAPNSVMILDPEKPTDVKYVDTSDRGFWLTFNAAGTKLFLATDKQQIQVLDTLHNNLLLSSIPAGGVVTDLVRAGSMVYAPIMGTNPGILVIDPQRGAPVRLIPCPNLSTGQRARPADVAVNGDGTRVYVALDAGTAGEIAVIDAYTTRVLGYARVGAQPLGLAITPDNRFLLCTNGKAGSVSVIDAFSLQEVARVPVGITPVRIAVRPDGTKAYVTCKGDNNVYVINLQSMTAGAVIPVGTNPMGVAVTSNGSRVFVACNGNGSVAIIDGTTDTFLKATTPLPRSRPYGVAVKP